MCITFVSNGFKMAHWVNPMNWMLKFQFSNRVETHIISHLKRCNERRKSVIFNIIGHWNSSNHAPSSTIRIRYIPMDMVRAHIYRLCTLSAFTMSICMTIDSTIVPYAMCKAISYTIFNVHIFMFIWIGYGRKLVGREKKIGLSYSSLMMYV